MKNFILCICLVFCSVNLQSQTQKKYDFSKEIDQQLWMSFVKSYNSRDGESHSKIHTKDVVRITKNGIRLGKEYHNQILKSYSRKNQLRREIEFKFENRIHAPNIAYEVGYFKITIFKKEKREEHFGRFSVVLKKEEGKWKIAQDWDTDKINGVPITKIDYDKLDSIIIKKK